MQRILDFYGNEAHAVVDKDAKGKQVAAFFAEHPSDRQRRSARLVDPKACTREWPGFLYSGAAIKVVTIASGRGVVFVGYYRGLGCPGGAIQPWGRVSGKTIIFAWNH